MDGEDSPGVAGGAGTSRLALLPEEHRLALRMRVVEERGYDELAQELGVSQDVVRARVSRGLRTLAVAVG